MIGPFVLGAMKHSRGDYTAASAFLALVMAFGATVAFVMLPLVSDDATLQPVKVCGLLLAGLCLPWQAHIQPARAVIRYS